jgi:hypothetical protein
MASAAAPRAQPTSRPPRFCLFWAEGRRGAEKARWWALGSKVRQVMSTSIKKVVVVGPLQSGKSCLSNFLSEYNTKPPSATYMPTVGCRCSPSDRSLTTEFLTICIKLSAASPLNHSGSSSLKRKFEMARRERSTALKYGTSLAIERKVNNAPFLLILTCLASGMSLVGQLFGGTASVLLLSTIRTEPKKRIW